VKSSTSSPPFHKPKSLLCSKYEILIKYTLIPSIPLSIIAILSINPNTWMTSEIHHFYIELFAVILAAVLAFYYIARARALNDKFSLFIGIGFLTSALIDLLHVIVAYISISDPVFLKYFIPQTWFAGRIFLSAMLVIAIAKYSALSSSKEVGGQGKKQRQTEITEGGIQKTNKLQKPIVVYLTILAILAASVAISSLFLVFPASVIDNYSIHRPYEIPSLVLFIIALLYFYKNHLYERKDAFYKGLLVYLIVDIFSQIIMSYSAASFDTAHNAAHVLKDAGYFINIIALALSSIEYNARLRQSNYRLRAREETIRVQYEKLKESDKMKDEFINVAAHELRTPIQPILSLTEVLRSKVSDTKQQELLDVILRNSKRSQRLTNDILDVTKIESQSLNLKKEWFNLNDIITNTLDDIITNSEFAKPYKKRIKLLYQPHDIFLEADKARITQVIFNLLNNAIKFTEAKENEERVEEERIVSIAAENTEDGNTVVTIKDSGIGIDVEILPKLFEKFASKSFQGTGLGLFISKNIVEAHGGRIWAENSVTDDNKHGKGGGATFSFSLPINKANNSIIHNNSYPNQIMTKNDY
jgi:signal transduction histidine kinase